MKTILVVDDELANAEVLSLILTEEGYEVYCASNGKQGLERAAEVKPDLIVLDYMMPVLDGAQMGRALRADPATCHVKIIMNSSMSEAGVRARFDRYDAFLRKPYGVDLVLQLIRKLLDQDKPGAAPVPPSS